MVVAIGRGALQNNSPIHWKMSLKGHGINMNNNYIHTFDVHGRINKDPWYHAQRFQQGSTTSDEEEKSYV